MAYEFVADAERLEELHNDLVKTSSDISALIEDIYAKVEDMNTVWSGTSYDAFKARCDSYKINLEALPDILDAFAVDCLKTCKRSAVKPTATIKNRTKTCCAAVIILLKNILTSPAQIEILF